MEVDDASWVFFEIVVSTISDIDLQITQTSSGDVDEYVQYNDYPSRSSYLYRDITEETRLILFGW